MPDRPEHFLPGIEAIASEPEAIEILPKTGRVVYHPKNPNPNDYLMRALRAAALANGRILLIPTVKGKVISVSMRAPAVIGPAPGSTPGVTTSIPGLVHVHLLYPEAPGVMKGCYLRPREDQTLRMEYVVAHELGHAVSLLFGRHGDTDAVSEDYENRAREVLDPGGARRASHLCIP
ncbi:MAG: hypothetical protein JNL98_32315 [Bryobacterales bacterium]|nr:hypothetical protein [Bryobacterales bacterium]